MGRKTFPRAGVDSHEPFPIPAVREGVRSFTVEEIDRLARVFRLLDSWDRAQRSTKVVRKAA